MSSSVMDGQGRLHWKDDVRKKGLKIQEGWGTKRWGQRWRGSEGGTDHLASTLREMGRFRAEEWKDLLFFFEGSLWLSRLRIDFGGGRRPLRSRKPVNRLLLSSRQKGEQGMNSGDSRSSERWSGFKGRNDRVYRRAGCGLRNKERRFGLTTWIGTDAIFWGREVWRNSWFWRKRKPRV